jgi:hypothetical protein
MEFIGSIIPISLLWSSMKIKQYLWAVGLDAAFSGAGFDVYYAKQLFNLQYFVIMPGAFHWMTIQNG